MSAAEAEVLNEVVEAVVEKLCKQISLKDDALRLIINRLDYAISDIDVLAVREIARQALHGERLNV